MFKTITDDVNAVLARDPAARNKLEIILTYPGLHALWSHRASHWLWTHHAKLLGRVVSQVTRAITGIEIHPGAIIGKGFFIDHGMGVVIGETAEVGDNVTLYHGVTLGGTSLEKGKRHPTLRDNVVVGAGAKILGAIEVGANSRIGANAVVVKPVPDNSVVVGVPGQVVHRSKPQSEVQPDLNHGQLPDTIGASLVAVMTRLERIEKELAEHTEHPVLELDAVLAHTHEPGNGNGNGNGNGKVPHVPDHGVWRGEDFQI